MSTTSKATLLIHFTIFMSLCLGLWAGGRLVGPIQRLYELDLTRNPSFVTNECTFSVENLGAGEVLCIQALKAGAYVRLPVELDASKALELELTWQGEKAPLILGWTDARGRIIGKKDISLVGDRMPQTTVIKTDTLPGWQGHIRSIDLEIPFSGQIMVHRLSVTG